MFDFITIELFLFYPCSFYYNLIEDKELAVERLKEQNNYLLKQQFLYRIERTSAKNVAISALKENNTFIFDQFLGEVKDKNKLYEIMKTSVNCGRLNIVKKLVDKNNIYLTNLAKIAIKSNQIQVYKYLLSLGIDKLPHLAYCAAECGNLKILDELIELGVDDYQGIAESAACGGYRSIVFAMINKVDTNTINLNSIACYAVKYGHIVILNAIIEFGVDDWEAFTNYAISGGQKELYDEIITNYDPDWNIVACSAAVSGDKELLTKLAKEKNITDWKNIIHCASEADDLSMCDFVATLI